MVLTLPLEIFERILTFLNVKSLLIVKEINKNCYQRVKRFIELDDSLNWVQKYRVNKLFINIDNEFLTLTVHSKFKIFRIQKRKRTCHNCSTNGFTFDMATKNKNLYLNCLKCKDLHKLYRHCCNTCSPIFNSFDGKNCSRCNQKLNRKFCNRCNINYKDVNHYEGVLKIELNKIKDQEWIFKLLDCKIVIIESCILTQRAESEERRAELGFPSGNPPASIPTQAPASIPENLQPIKRFLVNCLSLFILNDELISEYVKNIYKLTDLDLRIIFYPSIKVEGKEEEIKNELKKYKGVVRIIKLEGSNTNQLYSKASKKIPIDVSFCNYNEFNKSYTYINNFMKKNDKAKHFIE